MVIARALLWVASTLLISQLLQSVAVAQTVVDFLTLTATDPRNFPAIVRGAQSIIPNMQPYATDGTLPSCQTTNVLLNSGGFPRDWASLSAEQQAAHPINLAMMQLAYAPYQPADALKGCLGPMGIEIQSMKPVSQHVQQFDTTRSAFVMKAGRDRIFISIMGSNSRGTRDLSINLACRHAKVDGRLFGAPGRDVRLHEGFWDGWQALESEVMATVTKFLKDVPSGEIYITGHSLGAAVASIAALRLNVLLPKGRARVAGVWVFGSPRVGNAEWARLYDAALLSKTLRISNYQDFASQLPQPMQTCSSRGNSNLFTLEAFASNTAQYEYRHVGRQMLMCPNSQTGLTEWKISPKGSDNVACDPKSPNGGYPDEIDFSASTHMLGSYFDAWRRGYLAYQGNNLASDSRVLAVMCQQCTVATNMALEQMNLPARAGGPVTCAVDTQCSRQDAFLAAATVGKWVNVRWSGQTSSCNAFKCT